jgi:hypothetical protein
VKLTGHTLDQRLTEKARLDSRIDDVQKSADKLKKIFDLFKKIQSPNSEDATYTPVDFLIDLDSTLKEKIPENRQDHLVRQASVKIPIKSLSEECKQADALLESDFIYDQDVPDRVIGDRLIYSLKTCGANSQFLPIINATWVGSGFSLSFDNHNLETLFKNSLTAQLSGGSSCKIKLDDKKIVSSINCENFNVVLSPTEIALVKSLAFNNSGDVRFEVSASIFDSKTGRKKADPSFRFMSNGRVDSDPLNAPAAAPASPAAPAAAPASGVAPAAALTPDSDSVPAPVSESASAPASAPNPAPSDK